VDAPTCCGAPKINALAMYQKLDMGDYSQYDFTGTWYDRFQTGQFEWTVAPQ
jgi:hypothetical protein